MKMITMMKMIVMIVIITSLNLCDEVALVDWAGVSSRLGSLALACGQTCQSPGPRRGCSCDPGCRELGNCCLDFYTGPELDTELDSENRWNGTFLTPYSPRLSSYYIICLYTTIFLDKAGVEFDPTGGSIVVCLFKLVMALSTTLLLSKISKKMLFVSSGACGTVGICASE